MTNTEKINAITQKWSGQRLSNRPKFNPSRGGHAPGHLRDAFSACIERFNTGPWYSALAHEETLVFNDHEMQQRWASMNPEARGRWLTGQLWNCGDVMPSSLCHELELRPGSTYAAGARKVAQ